MTSPGRYFDYYEAVILVCHWPGCNWEHIACWDDDLEQKPPQQFLEHFTQTHASEAGE